MFDFDGVILESGDIKTQAFLELFAGYPQFRGTILEYHLGHWGFRGMTSLSGFIGNCCMRR